MTGRQVTKVWLGGGVSISIIWSTPRWWPCVSPRATLSDKDQGFKIQNSSRHISGSPGMKHSTFGSFPTKFSFIRIRTFTFSWCHSSSGWVKKSVAYPQELDHCKQFLEEFKINLTLNRIRKKERSEVYHEWNWSEILPLLLTAALNRCGVYSLQSVLYSLQRETKWTLIEFEILMQ